MPHVNRLLVALILIGSSVLSAQPASAQYTAVDLGVLPGATFSDARDINSRGQIVGQSGEGNSPGVAVLWTSDGIIDLGTLPSIPVRQSIAFAINNRGQVVGGSATRNATGTSIETHAFLWNNGVMTDLGTLPGHTGSFAQDINNRGDIVGTSGAMDSPTHAVLWTGGSIIIDLGALGELPGEGGGVTAINNRRQIVGYSDLGPGDAPRAFIWENGIFTELPLLSGGSASYAWDINARGQVVGASNPANSFLHAVLWDRGSVVDLGTLPGGNSSVALAINDRGQVVGWSTTAAGELHAFLWEKGTMTDLGTLPGGTFSAAHAINDAGVIVGEGNSAAFPEVHGTMWTRRRAIRR